MKRPFGVGSVARPRSAPGGGPAVSSPPGRGAFLAPRIETAGSSVAAVGVHERLVVVGGRRWMCGGPVVAYIAGVEVGHRPHAMVVKGARHGVQY